MIRHDFLNWLCALQVEFPLFSMDFEHSIFLHVQAWSAFVYLARSYFNHRGVKEHGFAITYYCGISISVIEGLVELGA